MVIIIIIIIIIIISRNVTEKQYFTC